MDQSRLKTPKPNEGKRTGKRWRRVLLSFLALCLGLAFAVAVGEVAVRVFFPAARDHALPRALVVPDPVLGWRLANNEKVVHHTSRFETPYQTNSWGFRDPQRNGPKALEDRRVLLFGDSQIFGWGVAAGERFSDLAEAALSDVEIWNLGVPGYGLGQQILAYEYESGLLDADAVLLYLSESTIYRLSFTHIFGLYKPYFLLDAERGLELRPPKRNFSRALLLRTPRWLYLSYFVDRQLAVLDQRLKRSRKLESTRGSEVLLIERLLDRALEVAQERGQHLGLILALPPRTREPMQRLCAARSLECFILDLGKDRSDLTYGRDDPHWNAAAHALIADDFVSFLPDVVAP